MIVLVAAGQNYDVLALLDELLSTNNANIVVVKGRQRCANLVAREYVDNCCASSSDAGTSSSFCGGTVASGLCGG